MTAISPHSQLVNTHSRIQNGCHLDVWLFPGVLVLRASEASLQRETEETEHNITKVVN